MAYLKSMIVKTVGNSKAFWLPKEWGIKKGENLTIQASIDGKTYYTTTVVKQNDSCFVLIPKWWPVESGEIIDVKFSYASIN